MDLIKPRLLKDNANIMFIAPAGAIQDKESIDSAKKYFENKGYNVFYSEHLFNKKDYLSDTDENRLQDLHEAFLNPDIDCIICARGGYGCLRLINKIDYNLIRKKPKIFCGYSDITILSAMFLKNAGLITYSGPMAKGDFGLSELSSYTITEFWDVIKYGKNKEYQASEIYNSGESKGIMFGGNLSSIVSLCGTDFIPDDKFIFFTEDLNEPAYKIDKMITQLMNISKFKNNISGIIIGDFLDNDYPEQVKELFTRIAKELSIPALSGFKITHNKDKITIPYGQIGEIADNRLIL